jgi:hypothetical protein
MVSVVEWLLHTAYFVRFAKKMTMRLVYFCLIAAFLLSGCGSQESKGGAPSQALASTKIDSANLTSIQWLDSANRDFGKIAEGQILQIAFRFKNSGTKPLVIQRVQPSCGCTIAEQPDKPIMPGDEGVIKAAFNSERHIGLNRKTLFVYANTQKSEVNELKFSVEVEKKKW